MNPVNCISYGRAAAAQMARPLRHSKQFATATNKVRALRYRITSVNGHPHVGGVSSHEVMYFPSESILVRKNDPYNPQSTYSVQSRNSLKYDYVFKEEKTSFKEVNNDLGETETTIELLQEEAVPANLPQELDRVNRDEDLLRKTEKLITNQILSLEAKRDQLGDKIWDSFGK